MAKNIKTELLNIITEFSGIDLLSTSENNIINKGLHIILSDSKNAIHFIAMIEDEFEIEIEDEDLTLDNLLNIENILCLIIKNK